MDDRLNKQLIINMLASFSSVAVNIGISFFLSPYIVRSVGVEAYGFVGLANNFISYASLITVALNALAGRFITVRLYEKDYSGANKYYSSVFIANFLMGFALMVIGASVCIHLENLIHVPDAILWDVKLLFGALFLNCIISTVGSVFSVATFATNKLYLSSIRNIESSVIRAVVLIALFTVFAPHVSYLGITSAFTGIYCFLFNIHYMRKLLPQLHISRKYFDLASIKELLSSGVWSLVTRLGQIFVDGMDLLITNLFIDATSMGILALAKTVPGMVTTIVGSMVGAFSPNFTVLYAEKKYEELNLAIRQSMKIMGFLANIPLIGLIVCGRRFYALWQPTQSATQLEILSLLTCAGLLFNGGINCIYNVFTVVNKLRFNSIVLLVSGLLSTAIVFVLLKVSNLGIYAVAGVSTCIMIVKNLFLVVPYASKQLGLKWNAFYIEIFKPLAYVVLSCMISYALTMFIHGTSWAALIVCGVITLIVSILVGSIVVLDKEERQVLFGKIIRIGEKYVHD